MCFDCSLREVEPRGLGLAPENLLKQSVVPFFFSRKEAKALVLLRRKNMGLLTLREAEPRGLGLAPEIPLKQSVMAFFFSRKEAKALVLLRRRISTLRNAEPRWSPYQLSQGCSIFSSRRDAGCLRARVFIV
jgi:hypothetical protein